MTPYTKFYNPKAIYAITPCSQEAALIAAQKMEIRPVSKWLVPDRPPGAAQLAGQVRLPQPAIDAEDLDDPELLS